MKFYSTKALSVRVGDIVQVYNIPHGLMFGQIVDCEETKTKYSGSFHKIQFKDGSTEVYFRTGVYPLTNEDQREYLICEIIES